MKLGELRRVCSELLLLWFAGREDEVVDRLMAEADEDTEECGLILHVLGRSLPDEGRRRLLDLLRNRTPE